MNLIEDVLTAELAKLTLNRLIVALSGGVDSASLAFAACKFHRISAVHINHGLHPDAGKWQDFCADFCAGLGIRLIKLQVKVIKNKHGLEAAARNARYAAFKKVIKENDVLMTAQHLQDQAETVLLRLLRGSGPAGLGGMRPVRKFGSGLLLRPWLDISKEEIIAYAKENSLLWMEDETNFADDFDRNFLRNQIIPKLKTRWPGMDKVMARNAKLCALAADKSLSYPQELDCSLLGKLNENEAQSEVYHWLKSLNAPMPAYKTITDIVRQAISARRDANPVITWPQGEVRRFQGKLYFLTSASHEKQKLNIKAQPKDKLEIKYFSGGEKITVRGKTRKLKKLFNESKIPPWRRDKIPLVYVNGKLVQVGDLWSDDAP